MTNVSTNTKRLAEIAPLLPRGARAKVARACGVSRAFVTDVIKGDRTSQRITKALVDYFLQWSAEETAREAAIAAAVSRVTK